MRLTREYLLDQFLDTSQLLGFMDLSGFGASATGLEYGVLGNMIQTTTPPPPLPATSQPESEKPSNKKRNSSTTSLQYRKRNKTPADVYEQVNQPFNYAQGFHYLIQYVRERQVHHACGGG